MKIISTLGGGGSTFVFRSLEEQTYSPLFNRYNTYSTKTRLEKNPRLISIYKTLLQLLNCHDPQLKILMRPDAFWTDWQFNKKGNYDPQNRSFRHKLCQQKEYIITTRAKRSAGLTISREKISTDSLASLVNSYIEQLQILESTHNFTIVLLAAHWGEYGIFKEIGVDTIYLIRDPYNSLISHSKSIRHKNDYLQRGLNHINTKEWIDTYLAGPHHYWINHAKSALNHKNATIVRYNQFPNDWQKVTGLPDISNDFTYKENAVKEILTADSINYIYEKTGTLCKAIGIGDVCHKYL